MSGFGIVSPIRPRLGCVTGIVMGLIGNHVNLNFPVTLKISGYKDHQTGSLDAMSDQHAHETGSLDVVSLENPGRAEIHFGYKKGNPTRSKSRQMSVGYRSVPSLDRLADITGYEPRLPIPTLPILLHMHTTKLQVELPHTQIKSSKHANRGKIPAYRSRSNSLLCKGQILSIPRSNPFAHVNSRCKQSQILNETRSNPTAQGQIPHNELQSSASKRKVQGSRNPTGLKIPHCA